VLLILRCSKTPGQCGLVGLNEGKVPLIGSDAFVFDLSTGQYTKRPAADVLAQVRATVAATPAAQTVAQPTATQPTGVTK
jgi:hypothetical protein